MYPYFHVFLFLAPYHLRASSDGVTGTSTLPPIVPRGARFLDRHFPARLGGVSAAVPAHPQVLRGAYKSG